MMKNKGAMMKKQIFAISAAAILAMFAVAPPSRAHDHATGVVKERMESMETMGKRLKAIRDRIKAKRDLASVKADAEAIKELAPHVTHLFPAGSTDAPTQATKAVWQNWPDFEKKAKALETEIAKLVDAGPDDATAMASQVRAVSQSCTNCHEKYRTKKKSKFDP
jgi:cytochrome c556